jgi:hypothetical protein
MAAMCRAFLGVIDRLDAAIYVFLTYAIQDVDARDKPGHDS